MRSRERACVLAHAHASDAHALVRAPMHNSAAGATVLKAVLSSQVCSSAESARRVCALAVLTATRREHAHRIR